jgi:hypothetical protein
MRGRGADDVEVLQDEMLAIVCLFGSGDARLMSMRKDKQ